LINSVNSSRGSETGLLITDLGRVPDTYRARFERGSKWDRGLLAPGAAGDYGVTQGRRLGGQCDPGLGGEDMDFDSLKDKLGDVVDDAKDKIGDVVDNVKDKAPNRGSDAKEQADLGDQTWDTAGPTQTSVSEAVDDVHG
jgi:hypothetical protein